MGKWFRNFLKKKSKRKEEKKRKLKIGKIQVLFETGTSSPHAPSVPTTSDHVDSRTSTPKLPDIQAGPSGQKELCPENNLPDFPAKQKKVPTLLERSQEFTNKLDEMIKQLTAMEASMEEEDKRRKLHPLGIISLVEEKAAMSPADRREPHVWLCRRASNSATNFPKFQEVESHLETSTAQVHSSHDQQNGASDKVDGEGELPESSQEVKERSWRQAEPVGKGDNKCRTCNDIPGLKKRSIKLKNLLARCLSVLTRESALTQTPTEVQLVQEIQEVLGTDQTKPVDEQTTPPRNPAELLNLKFESWDDIVARRLEEKRKSPWGRYLLAKGAISTSLVQAKQPSNDAESSLVQSKHRNDDDDSDDEIFITPASSLTSFYTASTTTSSESLLNIPPMELLEPRPWCTCRGQQTHSQFDSSTRWEEIHEKWRQVFSMSSNWNDKTTTFYDALATSSIDVKRPEQRLI